MPDFGGQQAVRLRSGATLRCSPRAPAIELVPSSGPLLALDVAWARGNFGGSELVVSPDQRLAALFIYSGQSEVGYELFGLEPTLQRLGGLPYVHGDGGAPLFSPDGRWLVLATTTVPRVRGTGEYAEEVLVPHASGEFLVDWAQLFVHPLPDGPIERLDVGMCIAASTDPDAMLEWRTYDGLRFKGPDCLVFEGPGVSSEIKLPASGRITLEP
jgi:hypothetical protein